MKLTDSLIKAIKPGKTATRHADGNGLTLLCSPVGKKSWRCRYRYGGKEKNLSLGAYPEISLKRAREKLAEIRQQLDEHQDPSALRKAKKSEKENDFRSVARRWHQGWSVGKDPKNAIKTWRRLELNVFPEIGALAIKEIDAPLLVRMAQKIVKRGAYDIAKRAYNTTSAIFRFAIIEGICTRNPAADVNLADAHIQSPPVKHRTALAPKDVPQLMRDIECYQSKWGGSRITQLGLSFMAYTFVRTSELINATWDEFDVEECIWTIPAERMKKVRARAAKPHITALSIQSLEILKELRGITGASKFVFPHESNPKKSMSNNTLLFALYRMGYKGKMTGHGFRGVASTILHERNYEHAHIEAQLSHLEKDRVSGAYNHAQYLPQRKRMLEDWANHLDALRLAQD